MEKEAYKVIDKSAVESKNICTSCKNQLNVVPIFCIERDQAVDVVCGRCVSVVNSAIYNKKWRQYAYENFAKFLTYPCCNKNFGCEAVLQWDEVVNHEAGCEFKRMNCPLSFNPLLEQTCQWQGNIKKVDEHVETAHKEYILNPPQIEWGDNIKNVIYFTYVGAQLVTILVKYEPNYKYYCLLMINGSDIASQCFRYQLELFDENKNNSLILRKNRLESSGHMSENINNFDKMLEIDLIKIREMLKNPTNIWGRFRVVKKNKKEIAQITGTKDLENTSTTSVTATKEKLQPLDESLLRELQCPVCREHMIPPIYICQTGHSICSACRPKVSKCLNCCSHFTEARNFTLEKLTTRVNYPCHNRKIGCAFVTNYESIRGHERFCQFSDNVCILRCGWKGTGLMYNHLIENHISSFLPVDTIHTFDMRDRKEVYYVLYVHDELFRFSIKQKSNNGIFKFNVQHFGMIESQPKFRYQLQIVDQSPIGLNLSITNLCQCLTENPLDMHRTAVNIPDHMIIPFIVEEDCLYYHYKIDIIKID